MSTIASNKVTTRDSNMELLRIIAMILVMIVHANFRALPTPSTAECNTEIVSSILRFINWIASSCFGIYLLHSNSYLAKPYYDNIILGMFENLDRSTFILKSAAFIVIVFTCAIIIDKIRSSIWDRLIQR